MSSFISPRHIEIGEIWVQKRQKRLPPSSCSEGLLWALYCFTQAKAARVLTELDARLMA